MNTSDSTRMPFDENDLAGEYVLGVLDAQQRRAVQSQLADDTVLAGAVLAWENRLTPLFDEVASVGVPDYVWGRICNALGLQPARSNRSAQPTKGSFWDSLGFWRGVSGFAVASFAALAIALWMQPSDRQMAPSPTPTVQTAPAAQPELVSTLAQDSGQAGFVAAVKPDTGMLTITPLMTAPTDGRVQELWIIPSGQKPISLGLIDPTQPQARKLSDELLASINTDGLLAVTLEPPGGGPNGQPSGPIIAKGSIARL